VLVSDINQFFAVLCGTCIGIEFPAAQSPVTNGGMALGQPAPERLAIIAVAHHVSPDATVREPVSRATV